MDFDATQAWCNDLSVELDDVIIFAIAELTKAPRMGYFDRKAWIEGWKSLKKDSIAAQKEYIGPLRSKFTSDHDYFKKVYLFCFDYAKEPGQKSLSRLAELA
jgi:DCN1-like protein 1/2